MVTAKELGDQTLESSAGDAQLALEVNRDLLGEGFLRLTSTFIPELLTTGFFLLRSFRERLNPIRHWHV